MLTVILVAFALVLFGAAVLTHCNGDAPDIVNRIIDRAHATFRGRCAVAALAIVLGLLPVVAFAAEPTPTGVSLGGLVEIVMPYLVQAAGIAIAIMVGWLFELLRRWLGLAVDAKHRDALQTALTNAAALLIARSGATVAGRVVDVRSPMLVEAIGYVERAAPDALKHFGLDAAGLGEKLLAKLPQISPPKPTVG